MQWLFKNIQHFKITYDEIKQQVGKYWLEYHTNNYVL